MVTRAEQTTAEELAQLPDTGKVRRELVRGQLREMAPAGHRHGSVVVELTWRLGWYVRKHGLGTVYAAETGFVVEREPDTVLAPDIGFARAGRSPESEAGFFEGPPDLAVEVVSPSDRVADVEEKVKRWLDGGVRMVWVVWPNTRTVEVRRPRQEPFVLRAGDTLEGEDVVPGFSCRVGDIFA